MRRVKDSAGDVHVELSSQEARQARPGWPVLYMMIGGIVGVLIGFGAAWLVIA